MTIKERLYQYIDRGDEKLLSLMYAVAREYSQEDDLDEFTPEQIEELDKRRESRSKGQSKIFSWDESKQIISQRR